MRRWGMGLGLVVALVGGVACSGGEAEAPKGRKAEQKPGKEAAKKEKGEAKPAVSGPAPALLIGQAHFQKGPPPKPLPAKLVILRHKDGVWGREEFQDPDSNVFHKAIPWEGGILTIAGEKAMVKHWTPGPGGWKGNTLYEKSWGGKFNRFRDVEVGDVTGDGQADLVFATHDAGVIVVAQKGADGAWTFTEFDQRPDTFVHEIEIGDVDGDGKQEFYATPSERNRASGESQPGEVWRYDCDATSCKHSVVWKSDASHAKEILVADIDGSGKPELYIVREAHTVKEGDGVKRLEGVRIYRVDYVGGKPTATEVAGLEDDQTRFLVPGDVDGDGKTDLIAAGFKSGLWLLKRGEDGRFVASAIDANSGGFEHATHVADLDGDGRVEVYVASDDQKEFRQYVWKDGTWDKKVIGEIGPSSESFITWNIQDANL